LVSKTLTWVDDIVGREGGIVLGRAEPMPIAASPASKDRQLYRLSGRRWTMYLFNNARRTHRSSLKSIVTKHAICNAEGGTHV
jgi:hypothetical protein